MSASYPCLCISYLLFYQSFIIKDMACFTLYLGPTNFDLISRHAPAKKGKKAKEEGNILFCYADHLFAIYVTYNKQNVLCRTLTAEF